MRRIDIAWPGGFLRLSSNDELVIEASNTRLTLSAREVTIDKLFLGFREYPLDRRLQRKIVYIDFAFPIKGLTGSPEVLVTSSGDYSLGRFGILYTVIDGVERYVTIYVPPEFLYEHAILSSSKLALVMLGRRQVYLSSEDTLKRIILV
ncbi:MAG: hypothetical protein LRS46_03475 [Desulfurococcales archaeon]|nr:hypothetical protein [Desulfurococcales archaeon]